MTSSNKMMKSNVTFIKKNHKELYIWRKLVCDELFNMFTFLQLPTYLTPHLLYTHWPPWPRGSPSLQLRVYPNPSPSLHSLATLASRESISTATCIP